MRRKGGWLLRCQRGCGTDMRDFQLLSWFQAERSLQPHPQLAGLQAAPEARTQGVAQQAGELGVAVRNVALPLHQRGDDAPLQCGVKEGRNRERGRCRCGVGLTGTYCSMLLSKSGQKPNGHSALRESAAAKQSAASAQGAAAFQG